MLCNICNKNPATVHLTEIVDNQMNELHLCEECARQKSAQMESQFGLSDLLAGLTEFGKPVKDKELVNLKCPNCGLTYADFKKMGRLGCGNCYEVFKRYLAPLLRRIHGSGQHVGKSPFASAANPAPGKKEELSQLEELKIKLHKAIENEAFEEAAKLRDQIREIEKNKPI